MSTLCNNYSTLLRFDTLSELLSGRLSETNPKYKFSAKLGSFSYSQLCGILYFQKRHVVYTNLRNIKQMDCYSCANNEWWYQQQALVPRQTNNLQIEIHMT